MCLQLISPLYSRGPRPRACGAAAQPENEMKHSTGAWLSADYESAGKTLRGPFRRKSPHIKATHFIPAVCLLALSLVSSCLAAWGKSSLEQQGTRCDCHTWNTAADNRSTRTHTRTVHRPTHYFQLTVAYGNTNSVAESPLTAQPVRARLRPLPLYGYRRKNAQLHVTFLLCAYVCVRPRAYA